jgi:3-hydroxyisobutyrate dehydrogenase-like beta-hydroxyacid dehydrogenase
MTAENQTDDLGKLPSTIVGFIGLGLMGAPMAANLRRAGFHVVVNDTRREAAAALLAAGAQWANTAREVAAQADVVFTCLPSLAAIEAVALGPNGLLEGARPGLVYFEMSTNSPELAERLRAAFAERGAHVLEAPISGGARGAQRGRLAIWVGGEKVHYERFEPLLRAMGDRPVYVGPFGAGLVTKLVHNCTSQTIQAGIAEVFVMGVKAGADPLALWEAIRQGSIGRRRTFDGLIDQFLPGNYDQPQAALRIIQKDMLLATELGRKLGVPMRLANLALADVTEAMNRGWGDRDARSVMQLPQLRAGVAIAVPSAGIDAVLERDPPAPSDARFGKDS